MNKIRNAYNNALEKLDKDSSTLEELRAAYIDLSAAIYIFNMPLSFHWGITREVADRSTANDLFGGKKCSTFTFVKDKKNHTRVIHKYKNGNEYVIYNNKKLGLKTLVKTEH